MTACIVVASLLSQWYRPTIRIVVIVRAMFYFELVSC